MAQEVLSSFGRGNEIKTAGVYGGGNIQEVVVNVMQKNGLTPFKSEAKSVEECYNQVWDFVINLCDEGVELEKNFGENVKNWHNIIFEDIFAVDPAKDIEEKVQELYDKMYRTLYKFYRDKIRENSCPRCTCGANVFCKCG
jgi:hypothetical protein